MLFYSKFSAINPHGIWMITCLDELVEGFERACFTRFDLDWDGMLPVLHEEIYLSGGLCLLSHPKVRELRGMNL